MSTCMMSKQAPGRGKDESGDAESKYTRPNKSGSEVFLGGTYT